MKKLTLLAFLFGLAFQTHAQTVARKTVVEHFTNTRCSVCASRNPAFYALIDNYYPNGLIHLAYHPSSPYANCLFSQQNTAENDARTNYYGLYGATPRVAVQGLVRPPSNPLLVASVIDTQINRTSVIDVQVALQLVGNDSVRIRTLVRTVGPSALGNMNLFVALTEDTVFYNAPNGETRHYDVFRKAVYSGNGLSVNIPAQGDSLVFFATVPKDAQWAASRLNAVAILQHPVSKWIVNADKATENTPVFTGVAELVTATETVLLAVFPNPTSGEVTVRHEHFGANLFIVNTLGQVQEQRTSNLVETFRLPEGLYTVVLQSPEGEILASKRLLVLP